MGHGARVGIAPADLEQLQLNLLRSHAAGVGEPLAESVVRLVLVLKAASLARGKSVRMALNQVMRQEDAVLADGDEVAFFPPVTGG